MSIQYEARTAQAVKRLSTRWTNGVTFLEIKLFFATTSKSVLGPIQLPSHRLSFLRVLPSLPNVFMAQSIKTKTLTVAIQNPNLYTAQIKLHYFLQKQFIFKKAGT
jgi:hypothetical protein